MIKSKSCRKSQKNFEKKKIKKVLDKISQKRYNTKAVAKDGQQRTLITEQ